MSRAFVRNSDADPEPLPDRPISPHPNFVTRHGRAAIEARVRELDCVRFGVRVTPRLPSEATQAFRLVGRQTGASTPFQGGEAEILGIEV
jgi:hypothetical protein